MRILYGVIRGHSALSSTVARRPWLSWEVNFGSASADWLKLDFTIEGTLCLVALSYVNCVFSKGNNCQQKPFL